MPAFIYAFSRPLRVPSAIPSFAEMQRQDGAPNKPDINGQESKVGSSSTPITAVRLAEEHEKSEQLIKELREQLENANKSLATCKALLPAVANPQLAWRAISIDTRSSLSSSSEVGSGIAEEEETIRRMEETLKRSTAMYEQLQNGTATTTMMDELLEEVSELLDKCHSPGEGP